MHIYNILVICEKKLLFRMEEIFHMKFVCSDGGKISQTLVPDKHSSSQNWKASVLVVKEST
jgi:hypothetical protein